MIARSFVGIGLAYALGSQCAGYYLVRWHTGRDVRQTGSASAGARNAGRLLGPGGFVLVLTFDLLKGVTAVAGARALDAVLLAEPNLRAEDANLSARAAAIPRGEFIKQWPEWVEATALPYYRDGVSQADPLAFHRSATSLGHHGQTALAHFVALPITRKGYALGGKSDAITRETARQVAAAGIPVVTVPGSGHAFCGEDPDGLALALAQLLER